MRVSAAVLVVAGLLAITPDDALAHGTISPTRAPRDSTQSFAVVIPNISVNVPMTGFRLTPPNGVEVEAEEDPSWTTTTQGRTLVWSGDGVPTGAEGRFGFRARLPDSGSSVIFQAEESYPTVPRSGLFPLEVALTGATTDGGSSGAQRLIVGLIFGVVLALAILAALLLPRLRSP